MRKHLPIALVLTVFVAVLSIAVASSFAVVSGDALADTCGTVHAPCATLTPTATSTNTATASPTASPNATATATSAINPNVAETVIWIYNPGPTHAWVDPKLSASNLELTPIGTPLATQTALVAPRTTAIVILSVPAPQTPEAGVVDVESYVPVTAVVVSGTPMPEATP